MVLRILRFAGSVCLQCLWCVCAEKWRAVGVLFSNLFVGIILNVFQFGQEMSKAVGGQVMLEMGDRFPSKDDDPNGFNELLLQLGAAALEGWV